MLKSNLAHSTEAESLQNNTLGNGAEATTPHSQASCTQKKEFIQPKKAAADDYHTSPSPEPLGNTSAPRESDNNPLLQKLVHGDCLDVLKTFADKSIDHFCTDAPYGLGIGGAKWDQLPPVKIWQECYRTLKPGGLMFVMSSARQDLLGGMIANIGSAGFDINLPSLYWTYRRDAPPRGYNIAKEIDRRAGKLPERKWIGNKTKECCTGSRAFPKGRITKYYETPKTDLAKQLTGAYAGFNPTPAVEVIIVAMKPIEEKTFLEQALANGKGVSWLGNCRTPFEGSEHGRHPSTLVVSDKVLGNHSDYFDIDEWAREKIISNAPEEVKKTFPFLVVQKERPNQKSIEDGEVANPHLTAKPLQLMLHLITMGSQPGDLICDPFMGSGTTLEAAKMLDRQFIGIEHEEEYYNFAVKRLQQEYLKRVA